MEYFHFCLIIVEVYGFVPHVFLLLYQGAAESEDSTRLEEMEAMKKEIENLKAENKSLKDAMREIKHQLGSLATLATERLEDCESES